MKVLEIESTSHLPNLFFIIIALDQDALSTRAAPVETRIASKDYPTSGFGLRHNFVIIKCIRVQNVVPKYAQPSSKFSHHDVCDELDLRQPLLCPYAFLATSFLALRSPS